MKRPYLRQNRLSDVIALIQVLALDENTHRSLNGLTKELQGVPKSGKAWNVIAEEHPEFFRFNREKYLNEGGEGHTISLVARHVLKKDGSGVRELSSDFTKKLIETAIQLHDKQKERADWWKVWLPFVAVIITVLGSIYVNGRNTPTEKVIQRNGDFDYFKVHIPDAFDSMRFEIHINRHFELPGFLVIGNSGIRRAAIFDGSYAYKLLKKETMIPLFVVDRPSSKHAVLDISAFNPGTYFIEYSSMSGESTFKLIIE